MIDMMKHVKGGQRNKTYHIGSQYVMVQHVAFKKLDK